MLVACVRIDLLHAYIFLDIKDLRHPVDEIFPAGCEPARPSMQPLSWENWCGMSQHHAISAA